MMELVFVYLMGATLDPNISALPEPKSTISTSLNWYWSTVYLVGPPV